MSTKLSIDLETFSCADLKAAGLYRYAADPSTEIMVACYAFDDEPVETYVPERDGDIPVRIANHIVSGGLVHAFNAQFERVILNGTAGKRIGCPPISIKQTRCSMARVRVHGLPGGLGAAAEAMNTHRKQEGGKGAMLQLSKPRTGKVKRYTRADDPERFAQLDEYCRNDVEAERDLDRNVPDLTERELSIYHLDQLINERGVAIDRSAINDAIHLVEQYKAKLAEMCRTQTGYSPTQTGKLGEWIRARYPQLTDLQAPTVIEALADPACPEAVKTVLKCYSTYAMKAVSKLDAMLRVAGPDDRMRGLFMFYGAGPGRWSSKIVQLQNMLRSVIKDAETAIDAMRERSLNWLRWLFNGTDAMKVIASCTRGMIVAGPGKELISRDFSQIESRIQAWLADATWKLEFFRSKSKFKIYHMTGSMMFGVPMEEVVDKGEDQKYTAAKISELACGFGGWVGAIEKMSRQMGMQLTISPEEIGSRWRDANVEQVKLWADLEEACRYAVQFPGKAYAIPNKKIMFKVEGRWLYMRLPSGRRLAYLDPELNEDGITYMGVDTLTRQWKRVQTYGGKLLQNACEGIGRDLLVAGLFNMEAAGYTTILTVHDEGVFEVPIGYGSDEEATRLMTVPLKWAEGLPVACSGWRGHRYRKE